MVPKAKKQRDWAVCPGRPRTPKTWCRSFLPKTQARYQLLDAVTRKGEERLALPDEFEPGSKADGTEVYVLTGEARQRGVVRLVWRAMTSAMQHCPFSRSVDLRGPVSARHAKRLAFAWGWTGRSMKQFYPGMCWLRHLATYAEAVADRQMQMRCRVT